MSPRGNRPFADIGPGVRRLRILTNGHSNVQPAYDTSGQPIVGKRLSTVHPYDVAAHLRSSQEMALYLDARIGERQGDAAFIAKALGDIARAQGMTKVARKAGLSRESLYKSLSGERAPDFATVLKVMSALGLRLRAEPA